MVNQSIMIEYNFREQNENCPDDLCYFVAVDYCCHARCVVVGSRERKRQEWSNQR